MRPWRRGASAVRRLLGERGESEGPAPLPGDVALLLDHPLFDEEWYARVTGFRGGRREAIDHYLATPRGQRPSPHPMFDREYVAEELAASRGRDLGARDVFMVYVRERPKVAPHPLFDLRGYVRAAPEARQHPRGPVAHYLEGGAAGAVPNDWLGSEGPRLDDWLRHRYDEWDRRHRSALPQHVLPRFLRATDTGDGPEQPPVTGTVTVVLEAGHRESRLTQTLASLAAQSHTDWHALVLDTGRLPGLRQAVESELPEGRWSLVPVEGLDRPSALRAALDRASSSDVAFLHNGDVWVPDRLRRLLAWRHERAVPVVCDVVERTRADGSTVLLGRGLPAGRSRLHTAPPLAGLLVARELLVELGGPDPAVGDGWELELVTRLGERHGIEPLRRVGVHQDGPAHQASRRLPAPERPRRPGPVPGASHAVLNERLVDWTSLADAPRVEGLTSVVMATYRDWRMTQRAVEQLLAAEGPDVEVVVVDNGCGPEAAAVLAALPERFPAVRVLHEPVNHGFALGNNLGLAQARGDVVVFLNNDTGVTDGWLAPLRAALADEEVLGAQPLLTFPDGTVQSAGIAFPQHGGIPYNFLQGFPVEDAAGVERLRLRAAAGAALALRFGDAVALHGFDPAYLNGMEDVDLCLRLRERRPGHFVVRPESRTVHFESQTPGRFRHYDGNRALFLDRWGDRPGDDVALWEDRGYRLHGHAARPRHQGHPGRANMEPLLTRVRADRIVERAPRLRWAIKNPAPAGPDGDSWGDTHFASSLASALRSLGQDVVVDRRPAHERRTGRHDDVALVLRGLAPYRPTFENVTIGWVISHPDMLTCAEAASYDRVVAASETWACRQSEAWGLRIDALLQATDPTRFHPDLAVPDTGHPVLFVGSSRNVRRPIVGAAVDHGLPLSIYGGNWRSFVPRRFVKGDYVANDELGAAYRSAGVVLNDHWEDMRVDGFVSNRLFDAAAAGARVITDDVAGLPDAFGESVQVMRSAEDLVRWSSLADPDAVFGSDEERRRVAARVHREHSFAARAEQLLGIAVEARRARGFDV